MKRTCEYIFPSDWHTDQVSGFLAVRIVAHYWHTLTVHKIDGRIHWTVLTKWVLP